jgi:hypothetical protein
MGHSGTLAQPSATLVRMKILDGPRVLGSEVSIHLTEAEAARLVDELASLRSDATWLTEAEGWLVSDATEVSEARLWVYPTSAALEAHVKDILEGLT